MTLTEAKKELDKFVRLKTTMRPTFADVLMSDDVVEVVRCRDCVMWDDFFVLNGKKKCLNIGVCTDGDFYCGWGSKE